MATLTPLISLHLATVLPALVLGTILMLGRKGSRRHKFHGRIYMGLMLSTALIALLIPAAVGPQLFDHFGFLHLLSPLVIITVPIAWWAVRRGDMRTHTISMISLYLGGLLVAGGFALLPGRTVHTLLFL
tara:strand:- start:196 stop:585 length:390 start_codon:yes stop_codon:yes gene_type:complete